MAKGNRKIAKRYLISGRVQGVGFRFFAQEWADQLGVRGYVRNLHDGRVEVYAIADPVTLEEYKRRLSEGPRSARVTSVDESDEPVDKHFTRFGIEGMW